MSKKKDLDVSIGNIYKYFENQKTYLITDIKKSSLLEDYKEYYFIMRYSVYLSLYLLPYIVRTIFRYIPILLFIITNLYISLISLPFIILGDIFLFSKIERIYKILINKNSEAVPINVFNRLVEKETPKGIEYHQTFTFVGRSIL